jgi:hypothetical protein
MMRRLYALSTAVALLLSATAVSAQVVDATGDFLPTYTGPQNADLDVLSASATYTATAVTLTSTLNGTVGTTAGSVFVWGVDRGSGTDRLITSGPPPVGTSDMLLDAVIRLELNGTGRVMLFPAGLPPVTELLDASYFTISGSTVSATIPFSLLSSAGFDIEDYTYIFWSRSELGSQAFIADLAPDGQSFTAAAAVPEPGTWASMLLGFGIAGGFLRFTRRKRWQSPASCASA